MAMFKGITTIDLLREDPRVLCYVLSTELARTNEALEAIGEELRQMQHKAKALEKELAEDAEG